MVLILSRQDDQHVPCVVRRLRSRRARFVWLDPGDFPAEMGISISSDRKGRQTCTIHARNQILELGAVTAVWDRRPSAPRSSPEIKDRDLRGWVKEESRTFLSGLWQTMDCLWVPGRPLAGTLGYNKVYHLGLAARCGFKVPRTVFTNCPEDMLGFYGDTRGRLVSKVILRGFIPVNGEYRSSYTFAAKRRHAINYRSIRYAPVILQEYVPKAVELRITVVGTQVFAAEIRSQASHRTRHDWRHYDEDRATYTPHELPAAVSRCCIRLLRALDLCFGTIDMVLTPEGEYIFLEINPNGQWIWIEDLTRLPISAALANLLVRGAV